MWGYNSKWLRLIKQLQHFQLINKCKEKQKDSMFERPIIELPGIISNGQRQGINGQGGRNYTTVEIVDTWNKIVKQVEDKGLLLATQFTEPPMISKEEVINNCKKLNC
jgi:hypothetical protein